VKPIHRIIVVAGIVPLLSLLGCASTPRASAGDTAGLVASDVPADGRMKGVIVNRRYGDFFVKNGVETRREIEFAWDYDRKTAIRRTYDMSGKLLLTEDLPGAEMRLTPLENDRVKALVSGYPTLKDIVKQPGVVIWAGGFVLRQPGDRWCDSGTRCIHAILSDDNGVTAVAHAIVDLQRDRVVYPEYDMEQYRKTAKHSLGSK
jgi:hypothetical protein